MLTGWQSSSGSFLGERARIRRASQRDEGVLEAGALHVQPLDDNPCPCQRERDCDGDEVPAAVDRHRPDLVLMDLRMPRVGGITATSRVRARPNPPEVVILTTFDADEDVLRALRAGASGFLLKDTPPAQIIEAIHKVIAGDPILSPRITRRLMNRAAADSGVRAGQGRTSRTDRP